MKSGFVNLIGRPNVGKSSILNRLIGVRLSIVTDRPQTTRKSMKFIYTDDDSQIIFFDNPGYQEPKNKLGAEMQNIIFNNMKDADLNIYVMDNSLETGRLDRAVIELAKSDKEKKILVVNKADMLSTEEKKDLKEKYKSMKLFEAIVFISAVSGDGFHEFLATVKEFLPEGPIYYDEEMITGTSTREIMEEILREKFLLNLNEEIPHGIMIDTEEFREEEDRVYITMTVYLERENHKAIVIGKNGNMINRIIKEAKKAMEHFLEEKVTLKLNIKVRKNWRKNLSIVKKELK
ncbi:MAG: GTPase Era [Ezakiella sp.]|nr:GTPase Era [Ezakiella sp.]MDD7471994.1 GTPase Era [Bacillota bacterium]MDY3923958.1 GTPase Era [Ezakiella sp.]